MSITYTPSNLPVFRQGTAGTALPKPGTPVVACEIPVVCEMNPWGTPIQIQPGQGYWHCVLEASVEKIDAYPNNEFTTFYEIKGEADPFDPRTEWLVRYWAALGQTVQPVLAEKTKGAIVVGTFEQDGVFQTAEGPVNFVAGDVLLESPANRGQMWPISAKTFEKKYQGLVPATAE